MKNKNYLFFIEHSKMVIYKQYLTTFQLCFVLKTDKLSQKSFKMESYLSYFIIDPTKLYKSCLMTRKLKKWIHIK